MSEPTESVPPAVQLTEVRYSLTAMLAEIQTERTSSTFAMEKLDQKEIGKLFKTQQRRRVKPKK